MLGIAPGNLLAGWYLTWDYRALQSLLQATGTKQLFADETHHTSVLLYTAPWKNSTPLSPTGALGGTSGRLDASQLCTSAMSKLPAGTANLQLTAICMQFDMSHVLSVWHSACEHHLQGQTPDEVQSLIKQPWGWQASNQDRLWNILCVSMRQAST